MNALTEQEHHAALLRRRVEFVIKYPALVRLIRKGQHERVVSSLCERLQPSVLAVLKSQAAYDRWLTRVVEAPCWNGCSRWPVSGIRWSLMAKLINILVYEIVSNRELMSESQWRRLKPWLHVPLDRLVLAYLRARDPAFPARRIFKGLTKDEYGVMQRHARNLAARDRVLPIWYEAAWSMARP